MLKIENIHFFFSVKEGVFRQFKGSRATKDFLDFIEEKQWEKLEPVTGLSDPAGIPMGILGFFFKLSYAMKDLHKVMTEDYKFSTWISYAFFTLVTILVGGLLGLVSLFFCNDFDPIIHLSTLSSRWLCCAWTVSDLMKRLTWLLLLSRQVYNTVPNKRVDARVITNLHGLILHKCTHTWPPSTPRFCKLNTYFILITARLLVLLGYKTFKFTLIERLNKGLLFLLDETFVCLKAICSAGI